MRLRLPKSRMRSACDMVVLRSRATGVARLETFFCLDSPLLTFYGRAKPVARERNPTAPRVPTRRHADTFLPPTRRYADTFLPPPPCFVNN